MKKRLIWKLEEKIVNALNENNGTDSDYVMIYVSLVSYMYEEFLSKKKYEIIVIDDKLQKYKMIFEYGFNFETDFFKVIINGLFSFSV